MLSQTSNYTDNSQKFGLENEYIYTTKIVFALPFLEFCFNLFKIWLWKRNNSQIHKVDNTIMILTCHSMEQKALFPTKRHLRCLPQKKIQHFIPSNSTILRTICYPFQYQDYWVPQRHSFQWLRRGSIDNSKQITLQIKTNLRGQTMYICETQVHIFFFSFTILQMKKT